MPQRSRPCPPTAPPSGACCSFTANTVGNCTTVPCQQLVGCHLTSVKRHLADNNVDNPSLWNIACCILSVTRRPDNSGCLPPLGVDKLSKLSCHSAVHSFVIVFQRDTMAVAQDESRRFDSTFVILRAASRPRRSARRTRRSARTGGAGPRARPARTRTWTGSASTASTRSSRRRSCARPPPRAPWCALHALGF